MENQEYNPSVLYAKLARVTQKMKRIRKTGRHPQGYQFATDTDIIEAVSEALADENMAIIPSMVGYQITDGGQTKNGQPIFHTVCEFEFTFVCADSGVSMTRKWFNEALDSSDKGFNKTATAALKYFLLKTFLITTGEPDEHESSDVQPTARKSPFASQKNGATQDKATTPQNSANSPLNAISDVFDESTVKEFVAHYIEHIDMAGLLAALGVKRFGEWTKGKAAAYAAVDAALKSKVA